ncbi:MAG: endolytic transglycosylase MltG [Bacteroidetes bacterium]|nr:endolytic transglycosylase MltG [Bacteroidota bacterium]
MEEEINPSAPVKRSRKQIFLVALLLLFLIGVIIAGQFIYKIYGPNTQVVDTECYLYIPTGAEFKSVTDSLSKHHWLKNVLSFEWVAKKKKYINHVRPGRYHIINGFSNNSLVNLLRSGIQAPVKLVFNNIRTKKQLAGRIGQQLETDSVQLLQLLSDPAFTKTYGFNPENILCMFIPNTYEIYWNISSKRFCSRMNQEYMKFWTNDRLEKASSLELTPVEVCILASIVEMETIKEDEKPRVAGVYLNRLREDMLLEADPTLVFALGDFTIKRVLQQDLSLDSPYNTYKYKGLPPGPITLPSVGSLDAVLHPVNHNYLYFCAKSDLSGYHNFSKTLAQHMVYAREYQSAMNRMNIKR